MYDYTFMESYFGTHQQYIYLQLFRSTHQVEGKISFVITDCADNTKHSLEWLNVS